MADVENMPAILEAIAVLNRVHEADPTVMPALIALRVPCNEVVAADPSVQVKANEDGTFEVGILGLINGIFGVDARNVGYVAADVDKKTGALLSFEWNGVEGG